MMENKTVGETFLTRNPKVVAFQGADGLWYLRHDRDNWAVNAVVSTSNWPTKELAVRAVQPETSHIWYRP